MNPDLNLLWRPSASRQAIEARARLLADMRAFFGERGVLEVETPILSAAGNTDPNIQPSRTGDWPAQYLRTSPEFAMKRLLAAGVADIYELGRVFRAGESGAWHNPEFTLLEWYRKDLAYLDLADEVIELVRHCGHGLFDDWIVERFTYRGLFIHHTGLDPLHCDEMDCARQASERGIHAPAMSLAEWLDLLLSHVIQPALDGERLTIVHDFPPAQAALARIRDGDEPVAERFEVYLGQAELANGYQELGDAAEHLTRFERDNRLRDLHRGETIPLDSHLIQALRHGFPVCSGVALGVDRLLMVLLGLTDISSVIAFPADRA